MPATIRIDFDVNASSISESLKKELEKVKGVTSASNSEIESSSIARIKKVADEATRSDKEIAQKAVAAYKQREDEKKAIAKGFSDHEKQLDREAAAAAKQTAREIASAEKELSREKAVTAKAQIANVKAIEKAELAAAKTAEKEREKVEKYLLSVRMNSIKAANAAETKAENARLAAIKKEEAEHKRAAGEHKARTRELIGVLAGAEGLNILIEKSKEATQYATAMQTAFGKGEGLKQAKEDAKKLGEQFGQTEMQAGATLAKIKAATASTGATQEEVIKLTQAATAMEAAGLPVSAKQLATEKGRQHILEVGGPLIANAMRAAQDPAKQAQLAIAQVQETLGEVAKVVLDALGPALKAVTPILGQLGELVGTIIKPLFAALTPIIALIGKTFADLTPIITELLNTAMEVLTPIITMVGDALKDLLPPIMAVVKSIMASLAPVFKALMPIIQEVAGIIKDIFMANAGTMTDMLQNVIVPLIRDLVAPILLSLMPVFKMLADMMQDIVVPAIKVLSGIMSFLMVNVVQPLIKWLSGGLVDAINVVVAVVTAAIKVVNAVVGAFKSLLGMGDDAAVAATKKTVAAVNKVEEDGQTQSIQQFDEHAAKKEKHVKEHHEKIKKIVKDQVAEDKAAEETRFKQEELKLLQEGQNEEDFKENQEALQIQHLQNLLDIAKKNGEGVLDAQLALINAQITQQKRAESERVALVKDANDKIQESNNKLKEQAEKDRVENLRKDKQAIEELNALRRAQIQVAENVYGAMSAIAAQSQTANHNATALEKVDALAKAGFAMAQMVANILANSAELGPFGVLLAPETIAAGVAMFAAAKTTFGLKEGGFTGYGNPNDPSGHYTHKNEFVLKSGSFAVDSSGNLVSVAGMGGGQGHTVAAIERLSDKMQNSLSQSTVINQRRMVLENKVAERSRSRASV